METLGCCGVPGESDFYRPRRPERVKMWRKQWQKLCLHLRLLIYTSFYSETCTHAGCCCWAEASGAPARPLVISLALCFHTAPGSVWIRSACHWSHPMFTLQWLIRAAVILSEGGRKLKRNCPIRQNLVLVMGVGGSQLFLKADSRRRSFFW